MKKKLSYTSQSAGRWVAESESLLTPWTAALQACLSSLLPGVCSNPLLLLPWCYLTISFSAVFVSCPQSFPASGSFPISWLFASGSQRTGVSAHQCQSFQWVFRIYFLYNWLVLSPCSPRDSQESSPAPQIWRHHFLVLSLLYGPTLTSIHNYQILTM